MLCNTLNHPTLAARRKQMKLGLLYRIVHGLATSLALPPPQEEYLKLFVFAMCENLSFLH